MMPTFAVATAHALVLTVSHGLLFRQPPLLQRPLCRRFSPIHHIPITLPSRGQPPLEISVSLSCARVQSQFTSSLIALHRQTVRRVPIPFAAGATNERAKPMTRCDPSTI